MADNYFPTQFQHYIHLSRYSRWIPQKNRRETFSETVDRYFNFFEEHLKENNGYVLDTATRKELYDAVLGLEIMPSMRALMTAGEALKRDNICSYNCSYVAIDSPRAFDEILYILMNGTGVGFSVEAKYVEQLPVIDEEFHNTETTILVADSKLGWAKALKELIHLLYAGQIPRWDVSKVRPAGAPLKTFGGRASGPEPLVSLFKFCVETFKKAAGRRLTTLECHDIVCKIAEIVVVGGVRRSALISLSDLSDDRMRMAKSGAWWEDNVQRALANNSFVAKDDIDVGIFMKEWLSLYQSKSGERGIFSRVASQNQAEKYGRRDPNHEFGTNPCLHPDSMVETIHGRVKIKDITKPTMVYSMDKNGKLCIRPCSASWVSKKNADTIKVKISSGKEVTCTPDHKIYIVDRGWVEAKDIRIGDKVVHLVRNRRGAAYSGVKLTTQDKRDFVMEHRLVFESVYGPIPEGYDVHHIDGDTYNNDIDNLECLSHADHATITALEQPNNHMVHGYHGKGKTGYGFISPPNSRHGKKVVIPMPEELKSSLHQYATVVALEEGPVTDVYDLTVEDTHNFIADFVVVHNCSEIILRNREFCNLSEVVVRSTDTIEDLKRKVRLATILGTFQSTLTNFKFISKKWKENCEEERLLGVSLTGIMDNEITNGKSGKLEEVLGILREECVRVNKDLSVSLGINASTAITCVKPSGTVSAMVDSASGIHARHAPYYIRTVRADKKDPLAKMMVDLGFPVEDDITKPMHTYVFSFPMRSPEGAVCRKDMSAIEQLELWLTYQKHWCEHKPSITVSVKEEEWPEVGAWVWKHLDQMSGVSFLPYSDHVYKQAPFQDCTKEEYEALLSKMPKNVDWGLLSKYEATDSTESTQTLACSAGGCELL